MGLPRGMRYAVGVSGQLGTGFMYTGGVSSLVQVYSVSKIHRTPHTLRKNKYKKVQILFFLKMNFAHFLVKLFST